MGVINITQRSERLGNIGGTSAAHGVTSTDIGHVHHTVAGTFSPRFFAKNSHAGDGAIASGLEKLGDAMTRISAAVMQREEDRKVDDYANAMLDNMEAMGRDDREIDDWDTKDRRHLQGQKRGFYLRTGEGTKTVVEEWDKAFADTFRKIGDSIDANDRVRERTMEKLASYRRSTIAHLSDRRNSEYRRIELQSAQGNLERQVNAWKSGQNDDPTVLAEIFKQQERVDALSLATPEKRAANREALAMKLTADLIDNSLARCETLEDFDKIEQLVKGGLKDALPDLIADNLPGGERAVGGEVKKALLDEVKKSKRIFLAEQERTQRAAERDMLDKITLASREARVGGSIAEMENAIKALEVVSNKHPKGTRIHVAAMEEATRLEAAADAEARRAEWDKIVESGGKSEPPAKGSRAAKFHAALKASYDSQAARWAAGAFAAEDAANRVMRRANEAALRAQMLLAAQLDPGGFSARLSDAAEKGHISLDQYRKIRDEFSDTWRKEGMPEKAAALVDVLKKEFFAEKDYDLNERLGVDSKTGKFAYGKDPDTKKPFEGEDAAFETTDTVAARTRLTLYGSYVTEYSPLTPGYNGPTKTVKTTSTLSSAEQLQLLDWALELAQHDGEWISTDPTTGERLERPRQLNAVQEFQNLCSKMKTGKGVAAAQETIAARAEAQLTLNAAFAAADANTVAKATKREAAETKMRETARQTRRAPFSPKMPGSSKDGLQPADGDDYTEN